PEADPFVEIQRTLEEIVREGTRSQVLVFASRSATLVRLSRIARDEWFHAGLAGIFERPRAAATLASHLRLAQERIELLRRERQTHRLRQRLALETRLGASEPMAKLYEQVEVATATNEHVLIEGEAGTGKRLIARVLHEAGPRSAGPFVRVDCRAATSRRLQSELFGARPSNAVSAGNPHDASDQETPCLVLAQGGTLVLTNIDALSLALQRRLRRHLQAFARLTRRHAAPRIVATSRSPLNQRVVRGQFDRDLHRLLSQHQLTVPPLRDRPDDILILCGHYLREWSFREGRPPKQLALEARQALREYSWPGNVRELREVLENVCALERGPVITVAALQPWLAETRPEVESLESGMSLKEMERRLIESTFWRFGGNRERTARCLHIGVRTLSGKLRAYGYPPRGGPGSNRKVA
ncbi:MAG TPA: sigma-54-dependent Fis family transcriptional regulator, partial [Planctomycetaceae bacterium]|nr:sigma-54-dependent Fis family transcriptional regulator [Planctomycetaceae bacterium]